MADYFSKNTMWLPPSIVDLTSLSFVTHRKGKRAAAKVNAAILHQTASHKGNVYKNYLRTNAHVVIMPNGEILKLHPFESLLWASSGFNDSGIAIEFVGNFPNDRGTWWKGEKYGRHKPTVQQIVAGHELLRHLKESFGVTRVFGHRQGYVEWPRTTPEGEKPINQRGNCPGPHLWHHVGEWAVHNLRLSDGGPGYKVFDGSPIPDSWRKHPG